jgi:hypothetical protein
MSTHFNGAKYVTWRSALGGVFAMMLLFGSALGWVDSTKLDVDDAEKIAEDIRLIKECVINGRCGNNNPP